MSIGLFEMHKVGHREKLWRKLKADILHLHRLADRLDELRQEVDQFLDQFAKGSLDLLRYVGLSVPD
jgi:hypothetical protein